MIYPLHRLLQILPKFFVLSTCLARAYAQHESAAPEIVSAWKLNSENLIAVFHYDGTYHIVDSDPTHPGMERGTFTWNKDSSAFAVNTIVDTNGDAGFSHNTTATVSISGNTLNYVVPGEEPFPFTRIIDTTSAIAGAWVIPGEKVSVTFLADNSYYFVQEANNIPFGYTGIERGTYIWNSTTKAFTTTVAAIDTNGDVGLSGIASGVTINITGNSLVFFDGEESTTLLRITTNTTPLQLPDYGVIRFSSSIQTSSANPALLPFSVANDTYPYFSEAFVDADVGATAPTVKIGAGAPIALNDEGGGSFINEGEFSSLSNLNAFLPNSTTIQFKNGSATAANLTTGTAANGFPTVPRILSTDGGSWVSGVYQFGENEVLRWTLPTGFLASQYITTLQVSDPDTGDAVASAELQGDVTYYDLGGKLDPTKQYEVELEFYRIDSTATTGTGVFNGKRGYALTASSTFFEVRSRNVFPVAPSIYGQPVSQPGTTNAPLLLTVGINDEAFPFSTFQWFRNNVPMEGQTGNSLYIPSFSMALNSGRYRLKALSTGVTVSSSIAYAGNSSNLTRGVERLIIRKRKVSQQQTSSTLADFGAGFAARVEGFGITSTFPASSISFRKPDTSTVALALDGDHWDAETDFASVTALQASFPNGTYSINFGADSVPINMGGTTYPNQPLVTASKGTWNGGKLRITASEAAAGFTLTTNSTTGNGFISVDLIGSNGDDLVEVTAHTTPIEPDFAVATVAGGLLTVGQTYEVEAEFDNTLDSSDMSVNSWATDDSFAFGILSTTTVFNIEVVPDPSRSPYTTWQSGFFNSTQLANPAISGDLADFDNDGIPNLLEYLFGGNPTLPSSGLLPTLSKAPGSSSLTFTYKRKIASIGVTQVIEHSTNLTNAWGPAIHSQSGVTIATTAVPGDATVEQVTVTIPSTSTSRFVRLKASR